MTRDGGHRNLSVDASVGDQKSVARRRRGPRQRGKSRCEPPDSERRAGGGRGISREAPPRCRASSQSALQKMPKISENQETIRIRRNPLAGASPEKLRFFIRLDAFFSYGMCSRWKRSSSIHAGTSGAPERSRCYGVRRCGAPPLRCVTNARSNPEKQTARRIEARPGRPPPRAAPPPFFCFRRSRRRRADWSVTPDDTKYLRPAGVHAETRRTPERSPMSNPALSSASMSSALATLAAPAASAAAAPAPRVNADEHPS